MKTFTYITLFLKLALAVSLVFVCTSILFSQDKAEYKFEHKLKNKEFCSNNNRSSGKFSFNEVREITLPASGSLSVDGGKNGGIRVKGENRSDVLVRACIQTWGTSDEAARAAAGGIRISTSPAVKADSSGGESNWSVSYDVRVPHSTNLKLNAHNGGISIGSVEGTLEFETTNGGVNLTDVAGEVKGRTTNGGVNVALSGNSWIGSGLDVTTSNGGVNLTLPETYAANVETGTVNGGFKSDIPSLNITTEDIKGSTIGRTRANRIVTSLNGGGAPIRVVTTNGGIRINSAEKKAETRQ
jgi:hypothetical protein